MKALHALSLDQLATECERRATEVESAGDRDQLRQIADQFRSLSQGRAQPLRLVAESRSSEQITERSV